MTTIEIEKYPNKSGILIAITSMFVAVSYIGLWTLHINLPLTSLRALSVIAIGVFAAMTVIIDKHSKLTAVFMGLLLGSAFGMMGIEVLSLAKDPNWSPDIFTWLPAIL